MKVASLWGMAMMKEVLSSGYTEERTHRRLFADMVGSFFKVHSLVHLHCCQEDRSGKGCFS